MITCKLDKRTGTFGTTEVVPLAALSGMMTRVSDWGAIIYCEKAVGYGEVVAVYPDNGTALVTVYWETMRPLTQRDIGDTMATTNRNGERNG